MRADNAFNLAGDYTGSVVVVGGPRSTSFVPSGMGTSGALSLPSLSSASSTHPRSAHNTANSPSAAAGAACPSLVSPPGPTFVTEVDLGSLEKLEDTLALQEWDSGPARRAPPAKLLQSVVAAELKPFAQITNVEDALEHLPSSLGTVRVHVVMILRSFLSHPRLSSFFRSQAISSSCLSLLLLLSLSLFRIVARAPMRGPTRHGIYAGGAGVGAFAVACKW